MSHGEFDDEEGAAIVTLVGDDGAEFECEVVEIFELDGQEYALLLPIAEDGEDEDEDMVVMRVDWADDDEATFSSIEDDREFERVRVYVESLADEDDAED
jgi:uncharacterized protein YrzB (UPF0473 family)